MGDIAMLAGVSVSLFGKNELLREGIRRILADVHSTIDISTADSEALFSNDVNAKLPYLFIIDASAETANFDTCRKLREKFPSARVVIMADDHAVARIVQDRTSTHLNSSHK